MGKGGNVLDVLPPKEIEWIAPDPKELNWSPDFWRITDSFHLLKIKIGEQLMLYRIFRYLFDRGQRKIPDLKTLARDMGISVSSAWRHLMNLYYDNLVDIIGERKSGRALKLSIAPLFKALRRVLQIDLPEEEQHLDDVYRALSHFAYTMGQPINNVGAIRQRLNDAANMAEWDETELLRVLEETLNAARQRDALKSPMGWVGNTIMHKARLIKKAREQRAAEQQEEERKHFEQQFKAPDRATEPEQAAAAATEAPGDERQPEAESSEDESSALPANDGEPPAGIDAGTVRDVAASVEEEAGIPDDAPAFLKLASEQSWPMVCIPTGSKTLFAVPKRWWYENLAKDGTPAEHDAAERALRKRAFLNSLPPAAAGGA